MDAPSNPPRSTLPLPLSQRLQGVRHVILPFDLRDRSIAFNTRENLDILESIFPNTYGISCDGYFLYLYMSTMPPKPWPKTIAGLPLYLDTSLMSPSCPLPPALPVSCRNGAIADEILGRDMKAWDPLFAAVRDHFLALNISITQVIYWDNFLTIVLEHRGIDISRLPWHAGGISCQYLYSDEMGKPRFPQARRQTDPEPGNPDENVYCDLQPGVGVSSDYLPDRPGMFLSTTAGVLLRDQSGDEFMTVAAQGFPGSCGIEVHHALPAGGRVIGEIAGEVGRTEVALVRMNPNETFSNETFENDITPAPVRLRRLIQSENMRRGDQIILHSPDTGCIDGTFEALGCERIPGDDPSQGGQCWVKTIWLYMGQDIGRNLPDRMCGSAMWTPEGDVVGFFRYAPGGDSSEPMRDWCCGIAADELINRGLSLLDAAAHKP